jgi:transcriptional regulator with XRE-family HTH domain
MNAAALIKTAREKSGLSKRELARRAGTSPAAIVKYESGQTSPSVDTLNRILNVAGWQIECGLRPTRVDDFDRAAVVYELLEFVQYTPLRPQPEHIEFPSLKTHVVA